MLTESEKRAAHLAVSRYGANQAEVQAMVQSVLEARGRGTLVDLLDVFLRQKILSPLQVRELRVGLEKTLVDPARAVLASKVDGQRMFDAEEPSSDQGQPSVEELRSLGRYRILRRLGEGGTGAVFLAFDESNQSQVALKVLSHQLARNQPALDRFYREAKSGALLNHPNIVRNLASGQDQTTGIHYLILEYVDGPSALELLDHYGKLSVGDAVHIILDIARALEHAHSRNVVHRDIKPGNILITQSGVAKLADLGLAKRTDETSHLTHARQGFGTPYYMPYEQAMNAKYADQRSDIYSLGATLYHLVTGELPFAGSNPLEIVDKKGLGIYVPASEVTPDVPKALDAILARMLARDPQDRYQTASELIVDLERSNLAAAVPSFVNPERAMEDPLVRQRLMAPMQTTALDMRQKQAEPANQNADFWFLRYKDRHGRWCKAKLSSQEIEKRLREGKLKPSVEAARAPEGKFQPLGSYPEYASVVQSLGKKRSPAHKHLSAEPRLPEFVPQSTWWWAAYAAATAILVLLVTTLVFLLND